MTIPPGAAALRHNILSVATGETDRIRVTADEPGVVALAWASHDVVEILLRRLAAERGESIDETGALLRVDLLLLELSDDESENGGDGGDD